MTGNNRCKRIGSQRLADGARRTGFTQRCGNFSIGAGSPGASARAKA